MRTQQRQSRVRIPRESGECGRGTEREGVDDVHREPWPGRGKPITAKANNVSSDKADWAPRFQGALGPV
ncbi:hypothetical protein GCM10023080_077510 [Streptomyces pseudoechinosporeus]